MTLLLSTAGKNINFVIYENLNIYLFEASFVLHAENLLPLAAKRDVTSENEFLRRIDMKLIKYVFISICNRFLKLFL